MLDRDGIADVLDKMGFQLAHLARDVDIISELHRLTEHGDPLLLEFYVRDLLGLGEKVARLQPRDLARLTPGFGAYFKKWFDDQARAWEASGAEIERTNVDAMLAILACALGPLKLTTLEDFMDRIYPGQRIFTTRSIEPLQRFVIGDGVENGYVLQHPKLAEYLCQRRLNSDPLWRVSPIES